LGISRHHHHGAGRDCGGSGLRWGDDFSAASAEGRFAVCGTGAGVALAQYGPAIANSLALTAIRRGSYRNYSYARRFFCSYPSEMCCVLVTLCYVVGSMAILKKNAFSR